MEELLKEILVELKNTNNYLSSIDSEINSLKGQTTDDNFSAVCQKLDKIIDLIQSQ